MELEGGPISAPKIADARPRLLGDLFMLVRADAIVVGLLLFAAAAIGLLWMFTVPFQRGPDEGAHVQVVRFILDHGRLPVFRPEELWLIKVPQGVVETYATFPPLAYVAMAIVAWSLPADLMWGARLVSLGSYLGTVALVFFIGRRLFRGEPWIPVYAALVVAFLPQFAFTGAYANNDALAVLESAALYYLLTVLWQTKEGKPPPPSRGRVGERDSRLWPGRPLTGEGLAKPPPLWGRRAPAGAREAAGKSPPPLGGRVGEGGILAAIGIVASSLLITKYPFYPLAAVALVAPLAMALWLRWGRPWLMLLAPVAGAALVSGWWFVRNWQLYGELVPGKVVAAAKAQAGGNTLFIPIDAGISLLTLSTETNFWQLTLQSFVAGFGLLDIFLPPAYYLGCAAFGLLAVVGCIIRAWRGLQRGGWAVIAFSAAAVLGTVLSAMIISVHGEYSPQGRYLFPILVPTALAQSGGWNYLARSHALLRWVPAAAVAALLALNAVSLAGYVIPTYYGAGSATTIVQIDRPSVPQPSDADIEVSGWSFVEGGDAWRPYAADLVASYRRPMAGLAVYVDGPPGEGVYHGIAESGLWRRDVSQLYGAVPSLERVGFVLILPAGSVAPGEHRVFVCAPVIGEPPACSSRPFLAF